MKRKLLFLPALLLGAVLCLGAAAPVPPAATQSLADYKDMKQQYQAMYQYEVQTGGETYLLGLAFPYKPSPEQLHAAEQELPTMAAQHAEAAGNPLQAGDSMLISYRMRML